MIQHIVLLKFKPSVTDAAIQELEAEMAALPDRIREIHTYEFGRDRVRSERSYDFGLVSLFANLDTLKRYQVHPAHVQLLGRIRQMAQSVITVDFEYTFAPPEGRQPMVR